MKCEKRNVMNENIESRVVVRKLVHRKFCCVCLQRRIYSESLGCGGIGAALETLLLASGRGLGLRLTLAHCTRPVFSLFKPVNKGVAIISSFTFARL